MLTLEHRPGSFREIAGQDLVKKSLMHICKDPVNSPHTILLEGAWGSGKTTSARVFARALNCPNQLPNGDACLRPDCPICSKDIQDTMFYTEYDSTIIGNVKDIRELRNTFYFGYDEGYKVFCLDEVALCSKQSQSALLKVLEEPQSNVFFVLCTTDPDKLLPTIVSRSLELKCSTIPQDMMLPYLEHIVELNKSRVSFSSEELHTNLLLICDRSHGHMRNALMLLDSMFLLKEDFKDSIKSAEVLYIQLFTLALRYKVFCSRKSKEFVDDSITSLIHQLTTFMISDLKSDYESFVLKLIKDTFSETHDSNYASLVQGFEYTFRVINILNDQGIYKLFTNDTQFQIAMLVLVNKLKTLL
jgi:DNA polymerase III subunit gamma/tau